MKKQVYVPITILLTLALDLWTKWIADLKVDPYDPVDLTPFFRLVNVENRGAAFSMLSGAGNGFFITVALLAIGFIVYLLVKTNESPLGLALILGGAVGNLVDRLLYGHVRDFLDFYIGDWHWPAFNIADSALTVGLMLLLIQSFRLQKNTKTTT